ncbi:MAG TPA: PepSY domain-containing protein [Methanoregulaceae archaeon]|jgi:hypothetical protein|uniref:PepSY domain-containing protein n=1 Tax=Mesotoga sp. TaxID=2053577 RepID=UPI00070740E4|nr:MAG: hypothetical protein APR54_04300 [Candidatus Cloacimonas sp. SDB]MDD5047719.1 PepSY domain-containing protein [Methanoregulaceae archaeon]MDY0373862.1 PepSY domain-containing protein [Candidatus Izemoplasmatales bacterium]MDD5685177.1 PepSY domain-containing protein [Methanoregulaceae archaeon]HOP66834.1 PepSY domain-containing protein [Methanoregulaceae archaeon]
MKKLQIYVLATVWLSLLLISPAIALPIENNEDVIIRATTSVYEFNNISEKSIKFSGYEKTPHADYLIFYTNENEEYWVNTDSYEVERYSAYSNYYNSMETVISREEAYSNAENFLSSHYNISNINQYTLNGNLKNYGDVSIYEFIWREYIDDVEGFNCVNIEINPDNGKIASYIGLYRPYSVTFDNEISYEEAKSIVLSEFDDINDYQISGKLKIVYDDYKNQRLVWRIQLKSSKNIFGSFYYDDSQIIDIDAISGEIIRIDKML